MNLNIYNSTTTKTYLLTNAAPSKPYLNVNGSYLPLTTSTLQGLKLKIQNSTNTYRAMEYSTYKTSSAAVGNMSSTTALTRSSASAYQTRSSISGYGTTSSISGYATRSSISGYNTRSSISGYATRSSISGYGTSTSITGYGTRSSISGYGTRSSISGYNTRSSISGYATRSSVSGYGTSSSISGYGTRSSISGYGTETKATTSKVTKYDSSMGNFLLSYTKIPYVDFIGVINGKSFTRRTYVEYSGLCFSTIYWVRMYTDNDEHDQINFSVSWPYSLWTQDIAVQALPNKWAKTYEMYTYTNGNTYYINTGETTFSTGTGHGYGYEKLWYQERNNICNNGSKNTVPVRTGTVNFGATFSSINSYSRSATYYNYATHTTKFADRTEGSYNSTSGTCTIGYVYNGNTKIATTVTVSAYIRDIDLWSFSGSFGSRTSSWNRTITSTTATLTRASTSATLTRSSTTATLTRASTSATLTRASTSATLTRASTSATLTRASTSATLVRTSTTATLTRASTSATLTRASTSATLTRASTSATLTRASTSATLTRASTSATLTRSSISGYSGVSSKWY